MENNQKGFAPIIIALIVAVVLGGGYVAVSQYSKSKNQKLENQVKEKTNTSEIYAQGVVVDNNLENPIGAYLQIKRSDGNEDIFVLYKPFRGTVELSCLNKIDATKIGLGALVEVKGIKIEEIDGVKPKSPMISTCESLEYYIRKVSEETANWKTYTNAQYGFEIKYPTNWFIKGNKFAPEGGFFFIDLDRENRQTNSVGAPILGLRIYSNEKSLDSFLKGGQKFTMIPSIDAKQILSIGQNGKPAIIVDFVKDGNRFELASFDSEGEETVNVAHQILSTFKFTSPSAITTTDWKTYKNEKYGFEIQFPTNLSETDIDIVGHSLDEASIHKYDSLPRIGKLTDVTRQISIDGKLGYEYDLVSSVNYKIHGFMISLDSNHYLEVSETSKQPKLGKDAWALVLSTLKFTSPSAITTTDWKTYKDEKVGIEFEYPSLLSRFEKSQETDMIGLSHFIVFRHPDPCDFVGGKPPLEQLIDFNVTIRIFNKNLKDTLSTVGEVQSMNKITVGSLNGFTPPVGGIEGCGRNAYYFPISSAKTLVVYRSLTEFNQGISILSGIITPAQSDAFFERILSTFKFTK